jgi:hypothetical protein
MQQARPNPETSNAAHAGAAIVATALDGRVGVVLVDDPSDDVVEAAIGALEREGLRVVESRITNPVTPPECSVLIEWRADVVSALAAAASMRSEAPALEVGRDPEHDDAKHAPVAMMTQAELRECIADGVREGVVNATLTLGGLLAALFVVVALVLVWLALATGGSR